MGPNLQGKVVNAPTGRARVQLLRIFLPGGVLACVLRARTKKCRQLFRGKVHTPGENPGYAYEKS